VGFAGRALMPDQEPKYINTPETPLFHKEKFLFGLNHAKAHIRSEKEAIIVEGEVDMISPYQAGYKNIVASKGTALTLGQIELLRRYA
ncbi:toprim domain-containing protein, partial [Rhizobium leguminosarum]|uniref:toprim domain-containing protein n=1 Tax=Rhizobium leguminosarum TaxID=384 RepID=UPI003F988239